MRSNSSSAGEGKALVAYASKHGSTAELAEAVARGLRARGLDVDVEEAQRVRSVDAYRTVVVGSAVYMGRWRPAGRRFLRRHRKALADRQLWLFSSGPVGEQPVDHGDPKAERWLRPPGIVKLGAELGASDHAVFGGSIAEDGGFMRRQMAKGTPEEKRDLRDWDEVDRWAETVAMAATPVTTDP